MRQVFVSYSRADKDRVTQLVRDLRRIDLDIWHDQKLTGGQNWWDSILREIRERDIFVFALSGNSLNSEACKRELEYVRKLGKPVLPVIVGEGVDLNFLGPPLNEIQVVDYQKSDSEAAFALMASVNAIRPAPPLPDPLPEPPPVPVSYFGVVLAKIESPVPLTAHEQMEIVFELETRSQQDHSETETKQLLLRMKQREDLLARVATKIDAILKALEKEEPVIIGEVVPPDPGPIEKARICSQCQAQILNDTRFCSNCGFQLDGYPAPVPPIHPTPPPPPNTKRCQYICPRAGASRLVADVKGWLNSTNFELQEMNTPDNGLVLQIKKRGGWRDLVGMSTALNIVFRHSEDTLTVEIAGGKWVDKAAMGAVGVFILPPLMLTAGFGAWEQAKMPEKIFKFIGERLTYR